MTPHKIKSIQDKGQTGKFYIRQKLGKPGFRKSLLGKGSARALSLLQFVKM